MSNVRALVESIDVKKQRDQGGLISETLNTHDVYPDYDRDISGVTSIYVMAHAYYLKYPERQTVIELDSENNINLQGIFQVFSSHPALLPANVTLKIKTNHQLDMVDGVGEPDPAYRVHAKKLIELAELVALPLNIAVNVALHADLREFELLRSVNAGAPAMALLLDADDCLYNIKYRMMLMKLIYKYFNDIKSCALADSLDEESRDAICEKLMNEISSTDFSAFKHDDACVNDDAETYIHYLNQNAACTDEDLMRDLKDTVDFDARFMVVNCQFIRYLDKISPAIMTYVIYCANKDLFDRAVHRATTENYSGIVVMSFSARQSEHDDYLNSRHNGTGLFMHDLHELVRFLNDCYQSKMRFMYDRFLMPDAYHRLTPGESHKRKLTRSDKKVFTILDASKVSYLLVFLHHLKRNYSGVSFVEICDDRESIFSRFMDIFVHHGYHSLLPRDTLLLMTTYNGSFLNADKPLEIRGSGEIHHCNTDLTKGLVSKAQCEHKHAHATKAPAEHNFGKWLNRAMFEELVTLLAQAREMRRKMLAVLTQQSPQRHIGLFSAGAQSGQHGEESGGELLNRVRYFH